MINYRKWFGLGSSIFLLLIVATQFQNCAPAPSASEFGTQINGNGFGSIDGAVDTIDDATTTTALAFNEKSIEVLGDASDLEAHGTCFEEQNGATLRWDLIDPIDGIVKGGFADCSFGNFTVAISDLQDIACNQEYMIQARLGLGKAGQVPLFISCD